MSKEVTVAAGQFTRERDYWLNQLSGELVKSSFPYDHSSQGKDRVTFTVSSRFPGDIFLKADKLSNRSDARLYIILVTGLVVLLERYTHHRDIIIGAPVPRQDKEGAFINTVLALRHRLEEPMTFRQLLLRVRQTVIEANAHQNYPIETLLYKLNLSPSESDFLLFDTAVLLENIQHKKYLDHIPLNMVFSFLRTDKYLQSDVEYNGALYEEETIRRIITHYTRLLQQCLENTETELTSLEVLSEQEKKAFLIDFNQTEQDYPWDKTLHRLFEDQVERAGDKIAVIGSSHLVGTNGRFIASGTGTTSITYGELNEKSNRLARLLREKGVNPDTIVGIMAEPCLEMIVGILGILKAGGAYMPIDPAHPEERVRYMLADSAANVLITIGSIPHSVSVGVHIDSCRDAIYRVRETAQGLNSTSAHMKQFGRDKSRPYMIDAYNLAYVIYTSGTTGKPKGVMLNHRAVVNYTWWAIATYIKEETINFPLYTSLSFDLTVTSIFPPLLSGNSVVVYAEEQAEGAFLIEKIVEESRVGAIKVTPSHLKLIRNIKIETPAASSVKRFIVGGEELDTPLAADIYNNFKKNVEIYNEYGPTEAAVGCMIHGFDPGNRSRPTVPIGIPGANVQIYLLDRKHRPVPHGVEGEIYISGDGLARGYMNQPELTAEKFNPDFWDYQDDQDKKEKAEGSHHSSLIIHHSALYRTGDLGRRLEDGTIEFTGRIDQQVKIRGYRIELAEIENQLIKHPQIKEAVVTDIIRKTGDKYICAYYVPAGVPLTGSTELEEFLSFALPDYMIPVFFIPLDRIPLTSNGKIDHRSLPEPEPRTEETLVPPRNEIEKKLVGIWSDLLAIGKEKIGIDHNFFKLGGHSLTVTILAARLHKEMNIKTSLAELYNLPTIRQMAVFAAGAEKEVFDPIPVVEKREHYPLSSAQKRLYILQQLDLESFGYNVSETLVLEGQLDEEHLVRTFQRLIDRHESFRTTYQLVDGEPVQKIHDQVVFRIEYFNINIESGNYGDSLGSSSNVFSGIQEVEAIIKKFIRPFDLTQPPLLRVGLIKTGKMDFFILLIDMHHIAADGTSRGIFIEEFMTLFGQEQISPLPIQYKDYTLWQQTHREKEKILLEKQEAYWLEAFKGEIPVLNLPVDYPRPPVQKFDGSIELFDLEEAETIAVKELAAQQETTLFMLLLALFNLLLSRLSSQEEVVIGTPTAARMHADLESIVGMFVNTLPLKNIADPQETFVTYLRSIRDKTVDAFENQEYPFEELVEKVVINRDTSRNPIFDVMFSLQNMWIPEMEIPGLKMKPYLYQYTTAKFDLNLDVEESSNRLTFYLEYSTHLFNRSTIQRFIGYFKQIVSTVLQDPGIQLKTIDMVPKEEKEALLVMCQGPEVAVDPHQTIHGLFEEQVERAGNNIAVICGSRLVGTRFIDTTSVYGSISITYNELNKKANHLAGILRGKGVVPDCVVGVMAERSIEMIIGILGILKAGGAYLGIDPDYPQERIQYMLENSRTKIVVTTPNLATQIKVKEEMIYLTLEISPQPQPGSLKTPLNLNSDNLVYVIYTSGSTGKPKGVMLEHRNLVNLMQYQFQYTNIDCTRVLQFATICFDISFQEIFSALLTGGTLVLVDNETRTDMPELFKWVVQNDIKTLFLPMSFLKLIFSNKDYIARFPFCVRHIPTAGEQVVVSENFRRYLQQNNVYLHNHYGPSETHVVTTLTLPPDGPIPELPSIGKPIQNTCIYIVNKFNQLQPIGVAGELLISGLQVGRGYLGMEAATAEKFNQDFQDYHDYQDEKEKAEGSHHSSLFTHHSALYRTGDLARWLIDGNIEFLGRIDSQVKIRGFRVEPGEIESQLVTHESVKEAVVMARRADNRDIFLCAYIVPFSFDSFSLPRLRDWLSQKVPDYMIPAHFVLLERIPVTPNGKVDRRALPEPELQAAAEDFEPPMGAVEEKLAEIWGKVLGIPLKAISRNAGFFESGGHSLKAIMLGAAVHKIFNVKIPLVEIFKTSTIRGLAQYLKGAAKDKYISIREAEAREYYPLSSSQKRFYILHQVESIDETYNMPIVVELEGLLDLEKLHRVFAELIARHECLRTSFHLEDGEPVQKIHKGVNFKIEYDEVSNSLTSYLLTLISQFIRPFDLSSPPLLRVGLIKTGEHRHILMADMHHIISDGVSQQVLVREFIQLYAGEQLLKLRLQYKDFSQWVNRKLASGEIKRQEEFWLREFEGKIPILKLPCDYPRPQVKRFEGSHIRFEIDSIEAEKLRTIARNQEATLFMVIFALFNVLLSKITAQEDIVVGTIIAGRPHPDLESIIGVFINILALRTFPQAHKSFFEYLKEVKEKIVKAFDNQDYQFEELVDRLVTKRDPSRNPIFDVLFTFTSHSQSSTSDSSRAEDLLAKKSQLKIKDYEGKFNQSKFDMLLSGVDMGNHLVFNFEYSTALFKPVTIERFIDYFKQVVSSVTVNETVPLKDILITHDLGVIKTDVYDTIESRFDF
jgi:tyrocidine synthetase-3